MRILHALYQGVGRRSHVDSISKDICVPISKKSPINVNGLDVGKDLRDNMIVSDMNNCIVILGLLNVKGVGNSLRGWMR